MSKEIKMPTKKGDCFEANGSALRFYIASKKFPKTNIEFPDNSSCHTTQLGGDMPPNWTKEGILEIIKEGEDWRLIHSQALHQLDNKPFAHCWIECNWKNVEAVLDFTSNNFFYQVVSYKIEYYNKLGIPLSDYPDEWKGIEDKYHHFEYTIEDMDKKLEELKGNMHWGAWDFKEER